MKMKKMIFLMLVFFLGISAGTNAQVNIGSEDGPQPGAVLDLSQGSQKLGLILPNVPLANVGTWQLDAGTGVEGTVVYNTNADLKDAGNQTIGKGIFVWVGNGWQAAKSGAGSALVLGFDLSPASSTVPILVNGTIEFTASGFQPAGAAAGVNWVIPAGDAAIAAIQSSTVTTCIVEGLSVGQAILTVTSLDGNVEKLITINVQPVPVSGLTLDSEATYTAPAIGGSIQRTATITPANAAEKGVNWTSNNPDVTITPSNPVASGTQVTITVAAGSDAITGAIVTATAVGDGTKTKTITIGRTAAAIPVDGLTLNSEAAYTAPATGGNVKRTATITPSDATEKGVNWTSNNPDVTITPSNPVASGTQVTITVAAGSAAITGAIVTATAVGDGTKTKTITIGRTAAPIPVSGLTLNSEAAYTAPYSGGNVKRTATITPSNADEKRVNWTSDNPAVTISPNTNVASGTQVTITVAAGQAAITGAIVTATAVGDGTKKKTITIGRTAYPYPAGTLVIDTDVKTGFISGINDSWPGTPAKSGKLLFAAADSPQSGTLGWATIAGYAPGNYTTFDNPDGTKFEGQNAGCDTGWRLPSAIELDGIITYMRETFGATGLPPSDLWPGFEAPKTTLRYMSSTYRKIYSTTQAHFWEVGFPDGSRGSGSNQKENIRCVKEI
jgi:uncharacterized protein YjdB